MPSEDISSHVRLFRASLNAGDYRPNLLISAHGGSMSRPKIGSGESDIPGMGGWFTVPDWTTLHFFGPHKKSLEDPGRKGIMNPVDDKVGVLAPLNNSVVHLDDEDVTGGEKIRNYRLAHFEERDDLIEAQISTAGCQFDLLQLRDRTFGSDDGATLKGYAGYTLKNVLKDLDPVHQYANIYCSFCRCTSFQIFLEKITLGLYDGPSHDAHTNAGSVGSK